MGIYISGVKGLPEQVQENKENIKDIQEEIEGIDWDSIHNLENQVAENTQDINNMEGTIGTQNIAITNLGGRVDDLEDTTSALNQSATTLSVSSNLDVSGNISFTEDDSGNIELNNETNGGNRIVSKQNPSAYIDFDIYNYVHIMSDGGEYEFSEDTIKVNGSPIGTKLYQHNINYNETNNLYWCLTIITDSPNPLTFNGVISYLYNKGFRDRESAKVCSGQYKAGSTIGASVNGIFADSTTKYGICYTTPSTITILNLLDDYSTTFTDNVVEL